MVLMLRTRLVENRRQLQGRMHLFLFPEPWEHELKREQDV